MYYIRYRYIDPDVKYRYTVYYNNTGWWTVDRNRATSYALRARRYKELEEAVTTVSHVTRGWSKREFINIIDENETVIVHGGLLA